MTTKVKVSHVLFFISLTITILGFVFFLWSSLDIIINGDPEDAGQGIGKALLIVILIVYGSIGFGICTILNIVSYILQKVSKTSNMWNVIKFTSIFLPAICEGISILLFYLP